MPFIGDDVITPLATDLSTNELLQVMWVRKRAADDKTLRCRLGGDPETIDGASVIVSSEDNASVILQITGQSAPQRPPKGRPYAPGCFVGRAGRLSRGLLVRGGLVGLLHGRLRVGRVGRTTSRRPTPSSSCARRGRSRSSRTPSP